VAAERTRVGAIAAEAADAVGVDGDAVDERYEALWRAIVAGSGNVAYQLALNSLIGALAAYEGIAEAVRPANAVGIRRLGAAIAAGHGEDAAAAAEALLEPDTHALG
jgi:DNA-binding FadR family transcriptional regulator